MTWFSGWGATAAHAKPSQQEPKMIDRLRYEGRMDLIHTIGKTCSFFSTVQSISMMGLELSYSRNSFIFDGNSVEDLQRMAWTPPSPLQGQRSRDWS